MAFPSRPPCEAPCAYATGPLPNTALRKGKGNEGSERFGKEMLFQGKINAGFGLHTARFPAFPAGKGASARLARRLLQSFRHRAGFSFATAKTAEEQPAPGIGASGLPGCEPSVGRRIDATINFLPQFYFRRFIYYLAVHDYIRLTNYRAGCADTYRGLSFWKGMKE